MVAWDVGPFDNDPAADWSGDLHDADPQERLAMISEALSSTAEETEYLHGALPFEAVAAAAVVASQIPGGPPIDSPYGPDFLAEGGHIDLPSTVRQLARQALERVVGDDSEWRDLWDDAGQLDEAVAALDPIRAALSGPSGA
jgi:Domain of unknown function (DUF4259)